ncbi:hypothetical protein, partial [Streptomyces sp. NPDC051677]|uniref:hypothetical protein n=1 Tax=Streptomyces sp. NPDC051677 TaxID=3365669 RepID=UPI0037CE0DB1
VDRRVGPRDDRRVVDRRDTEGVTMSKKKPPTAPAPAPDGLIIRSTPFTGDDSRRLARHQQQESSDRRSLMQLHARGRWIGAIGRRPRRWKDDE